MARDPMAKRFTEKQQNKRLGDLAKRARGGDDIEEEKQLIEETEKVEPIKADKAPKRNDPCPCGSGKKYKKCCAGKA